MERRKFLTSSSAIALSGSSFLIGQEGILALEFNLEDIPEKDPREIDSLKITFSKLTIKPYYIDDSIPIEITVKLEIKDHSSTKVSETISVSNGQTTNMQDERINPIVIDDLNINDSTSFLEGSISIQVNHPDIEEEYNQSFTISTPTIINADGGDTIIDKEIGGQEYRIHVFETVGNHTLDINQSPSGETIDVLVVGGGGGGGYTHSGSDHGSGGGGAGGLIYESDYSVSKGESISIKVGSGGSGASQNGEQGENGDNSQFSDLTAIGGGGGGTRSGDEGGRDGGSGGGCSSSNGGGNTIQNSSEGIGIGSDGGGAKTSTGETAGGAGGGGATQQGDPGSGDRDTNDIIGGSGGDGKDFSSKFGTGFGESGYFAGGGGGGESTYSTVDTRASGGQGGGAQGGRINSREGLNATENTGGGGGGAAASSGDGTYLGGDGGSGIVLVRYPI